MKPWLLLPDPVPGWFSVSGTSMERMTPEVSKHKIRLYLKMFILSGQNWIRNPGYKCKMKILSSCLYFIYLKKTCINGRLCLPGNTPCLYKQGRPFPVNSVPYNRMARLELLLAVVVVLPGLLDASHILRKRADPSKKGKSTDKIVLLNRN